MQKLKYSMEARGEAQRLELQSQLPAYQIKAELEGIGVKNGDKILDAGCGSGVLSRFLVQNFPQVTVDAMDASAQRLSEAKALCDQQLQNQIRFKEADLGAIPSDDQTYDWVICRFVLEHVKNPEKLVSEFLRVLKPGGRLCLIDWDGIIFNLYPTSPELGTMIEKIRHQYPGDLGVGRKLPSYMSSVGFNLVKWKVEAISFQEETLAAERDQTESRLTFAKPTLVQILGSEVAAQKFKKLYCEEMMNTGATLFYNKFIVIGTR
jgi:ubiquinone/menaquinone biosynthesis C-methylase UbiE